MEWIQENTMAQFIHFGEIHLTKSFSFLLVIGVLKYGVKIKKPQLCKLDIIHLT